MYVYKCVHRLDYEKVLVLSPILTLSWVMLLLRPIYLEISLSSLLITKWGIYELILTTALVLSLSQLWHHTSTATFHKSLSIPDYNLDLLSWQTYNAKYYTDISPDTNWLPPSSHSKKTNYKIGGERKFRNDCPHLVQKTMKGNSEMIALISAFKCINIF